MSLCNAEIKVCCPCVALGKLSAREHLFGWFVKGGQTWCQLQPDFVSSFPLYWRPPCSHHEYYKTLFWCIFCFSFYRWLKEHFLFLWHEAQECGSSGFWRLLTNFVNWFNLQQKHSGWSWNTVKIKQKTHSSSLASSMKSKTMLEERLGSQMVIAGLVSASNLCCMSHPSHSLSHLHSINK